MKHRMHGLSLVELLAAMAAGLALGLLLIDVFSLARQSLRQQDAGARLQDNARVALELLARSIRAADRWGGSDPATLRGADTLRLSGRSGAKLCTGSWIADPLDAVHGFDGAATPPLDCLAATDYVPYSDLLLLKGAGSDGYTNATPDAGASSIWLRAAAGGSGYLFRLGELSSAIAAVPALSGQDQGIAHWPYNVAVYALRPCSVQAAGGHCSAAADGGRPLPTLIAIQLNGSAALEERPLVEMIEQLQFEYGLDSDGDRQVDRYRPAAAISDWSQVLAVRIGLVARSDLRARVADRRRYELPGGMAYSADERDALWQRRVFVRDVAIRARLRR